MSSNGNNRAIVITAPSGAGKTTLVKLLLEKRDDLSFSISACTREKRDFETDGKDYYFLTPEKFKKKLSEDAFIEWEEVYADMFYGTLKSELTRIWSRNKSVIFDIDVKGAVNIKEQLGGQVITIFIKPPSKEELFFRLKGRGTETEETIKKRFDRSVLELAFEHQFDHVVVNDNLALAFDELNEIIDAFLAN
jgi:guanylate kinase